ncbi:cystathionine beta-lyase [Pyrus ussuriensis x Pyrus communis]|uniref:Cystathionine beta-lyase n=1 Tax=Pyrus ussuriensis x Pyrus communis TaxID=2448454 RepID=A0A5N5G4N1_9ROSA|nr:cystathionine beta-lyase [Pyrus ussuriensis x Pyrus communis]
MQSTPLNLDSYEKYQPTLSSNNPYDWDPRLQLPFCFTSGMAAVAHHVGTGEEIVAGDDIYGGSNRLLSQIIPKTGVVVNDLDEVASAIGPSTKLVWLESPTNPRQIISDIRKIAEMAPAHGAIVLVDNSIMSPFIAGHSDVMAGVLAVKGYSLAKQLYFLRSAEGSGLAPFDCWICLRGMKTMALHVEKQQIDYRGLFSLRKLISKADRVLNYVKSLVSLPCFTSHASTPSAVREARGLSEDLIRISVGIEDANDFIAVLDHALKTGPL